MTRPQPSTRDPRPSASAGRSLPLLLGAVGGGAFLLTGGALAIGARIMARTPLLPQSSARARADVMVRAAYPDRVHLDHTPETARAGCLALRQSGGAAHARLGPVTGRPTPTTVSRPILALDTAEPLVPGPASTNGFFWPGTPASAHGIAFEDVEIASPVGPMPAWLVRPEPGRAADGAAGTWVILVHGHGATRGEALRVIPLLRELGLTTLTITYRNDTGAPASADSMHHLGAAEWEDAEAALAHALAAGAERVVLFGFSMGGGIALRTSVLSAHRGRIAGLILDSPAVDWRDILTYHAKAMRAPAPMRRLALWMMSSTLGRRLVRLHEPLALAEMHPAFYAEHLTHPALLVHAREDSTVPLAPSRELARLAPDLVRYVEVEGASHTREWNRDPAAYERLIAEHLVDLLGLDVDPAALRLPIRDPASPAGEGSTGERI
ncbi:lysophospholipase [Brachybacterium sp. JHP9]|uniref:Lysophospholipase n=1 Tax=Brachybacterium equifaecis TaxID=2910770 RepID=A0ABT0R186_9MICO|nr:alpha/beta fold hydrolase [Brachybacterium equifaecis]MCL6423519.1 lysophospholipase [Brachybacterium equifaecis]